MVEKAIKWCLVAALVLVLIGVVVFVTKWPDYQRAREVQYDDAGMRRVDY